MTDVRTPLPSAREAPVPRAGVGVIARIPIWVQALLCVVAFAAALELVVRIGAIPSRYFPPPSEIMSTLGDQAGAAAFWSAVGDTLAGWALGLLVAAVIAIPLGMAIGASEVAYRAARVTLEFLRPIPAVALIPLAILIYGSGLASKVFLAAFASTWPLLIQAMYGVRELDTAQRDTVRAYRIRLSDRLLRVALPSAVPFIATGLRIASATSLILVVSAELIIGSPGLGKQISLAQAAGAVDVMYAYIVATGLLGWLINVGFMQLERRVLSWHPSQREVLR